MYHDILHWPELCFCAVLVQISIKIGSRRYAEVGLGTTQMCCVGAIKAEWPFVCSRLLVFTWSPKLANSLQEDQGSRVER